MFKIDVFFVLIDNIIVSLVMLLGNLLKELKVFVVGGLVDMVLSGLFFFYGVDYEVLGC